MCCSRASDDIEDNIWPIANGLRNTTTGLKDGMNSI
jgi:hypothetical protein